VKRGSSRRSVLGIVIALPALAACQALPAVQSTLDVALVSVEGIEATLVGIKAFADDYFLAHPDAATQAKVDAGFVRTQQVLAVVVDAIKAAKDVTDLAVTQAMADLQKAYEDLLALTKPLGVVPSAAKHFGAERTGVMLVVPAVLSLGAS